MAIVSPTTENPPKMSKFTVDAVLFDMVRLSFNVHVAMRLGICSQPTSAHFSPPPVPVTARQDMTNKQDGTLTDSIAAVEAAWTAKAEELGLDPDEVIAATHGRRAEDNLLELVPNLKREDVHKAVDGEFATHLRGLAGGAIESMLSPVLSLYAESVALVSCAPSRTYS